jgi:hypothetical protein
MVMPNLVPGLVSLMVRFELLTGALDILEERLLVRAIES